ncbi:hypothetical protein niasHT_006642 [Heterodera trifolii]|uniref:Uncharacterized protein n=1 Tax=Heterodera trifolii TaxID=157864 RepID=A0ABD2MCY7_9BILA
MPKALRMDTHKTQFQFRTNSESANAELRRIIFRKLLADPKLAENEKDIEQSAQNGSEIGQHIISKAKAVKMEAMGSDRIGSPGGICMVSKLAAFLREPNKVANPKKGVSFLKSVDQWWPSECEQREEAESEVEIQRMYLTEGNSELYSDFLFVWRQLATLRGGPTRLHKYLCMNETEIELKIADDERYTDPGVFRSAELLQKHYLDAFTTIDPEPRQALKLATDIFCWVLWLENDVLKLWDHKTKSKMMPRFTMAWKRNRWYYEIVYDQMFDIEEEAELAKKKRQIGILLQKSKHLVERMLKMPDEKLRIELPNKKLERLKQSGQGGTAPPPPNGTVDREWHEIRRKTEEGKVDEKQSSAIEEWLKQRHFDTIKGFLCDSEKFNREFEQRAADNVMRIDTFVGEVESVSEIFDLAEKCKEKFANSEENAKNQNENFNEKSEENYSDEKERKNGKKLGKDEEKDDQTKVFDVDEALKFVNSEKKNNEGKDKKKKKGNKKPKPNKMPSEIGTKSEEENQNEHKKPKNGKEEKNLEKAEMIADKIPSEKKGEEMGEKIGISDDDGTLLGISMAIRKEFEVIGLLDDEKGFLRFLEDEFLIKIFKQFFTNSSDLMRQIVMIGCHVNEIGHRMEIIGKLYPTDDKKLLNAFKELEIAPSKWINKKLEQNWQLIRNELATKISQNNGDQIAVNSPDEKINQTEITPRPNCDLDIFCLKTLQQMLWKHTKNILKFVNANATDEKGIENEEKEMDFIEKQIQMRKMALALLAYKNHFALSELQIGASAKENFAQTLIEFNWGKCHKKNAEKGEKSEEMPLVGTELDLFCQFFNQFSLMVQQIKQDQKLHMELSKYLQREFEFAQIFGISLHLQEIRHFDGQNGQLLANDSEALASLDLFISKNGFGLIKNEQKLKIEEAISEIEQIIRKWVSVVVGGGWRSGRGSGRLFGAVLPPPGMCCCGGVNCCIADELMMKTHKCSGKKQFTSTRFVHQQLKVRQQTNMDTNNSNNGGGNNGGRKAPPSRTGRKRLHESSSSNNIGGGSSSSANIFADGDSSSTVRGASTRSRQPQQQQLQPNYNDLELLLIPGIDDVNSPAPQPQQTQTVQRPIGTGNGRQIVAANSAFRGASVDEALQDVLGGGSGGAMDQRNERNANNHGGSSGGGGGGDSTSALQLEHMRGAVALPTQQQLTLTVSNSVDNGGIMQHPNGGGGIVQHPNGGGGIVQHPNGGGGIVQHPNGGGGIVQHPNGGGGIVQHPNGGGSIVQYPNGAVSGASVPMWSLNNSAATFAALMTAGGGDGSCAARPGGGTPSMVRGIVGGGLEALPPSVREAVALVHARQRQKMVNNNIQPEFASVVPAIGENGFSNLWWIYLEWQPDMVMNRVVGLVVLAGPFTTQTDISGYDVRIIFDHHDLEHEMAMHGWQECVPRMSNICAGQIVEFTRLKVRAQGHNAKGSFPFTLLYNAESRHRIVGQSSSAVATSVFNPPSANTPIIVEANDNNNNAISIPSGVISGSISQQGGNGLFGGSGSNVMAAPHQTDQQ